MSLAVSELDTWAYCKPTALVLIPKRYSLFALVEPFQIEPFYRVV